MLSVSDLTLERYFEPVFRPVSFTLKAGRALLITGANGSGKTTLIRLLAGVLRPSQGEARCDFERRVYIGHQLAVKDDLSVRENLHFMGKFQGRGASDIEDVIHHVGLRRVASQLARTLSAGQRKRCALARLLLSEASLWLLDEPYSNLDPQGMSMLDGMLHRHLQAGGACVLTTHGSLLPQGLETQELRLESGAAT
ncbi:MAG: heme ABC exporter ATP-binding protein CcmA [Xanthomonadales bacterium]|nr:heme ABC exporter ATP-binding protein CcmA [Xanthomonadales bacterium]NIT46232.1 heme ABC exporter ATP-binding protein CcmA [Stutzerimonas stutzeri]NIN59912.1 heme ABC exporter ATP-binding protein CcmA [Xanthomonadales bacterium]NIN75286.1 heme ABC exporter ATP-binding protein CcmA [Xanthomonadales bacterium]NIO15155.1 heme ABC exporter ATP-binding protein CcmA [Xanthomonadales bacterium]